MYDCIGYASLTGSSIYYSIISIVSTLTADSNANGISKYTEHLRTWKIIIAIIFKLDLEMPYIEEAFYKKLINNRRQKNFRSFMLKIVAYPRGGG